MRVEDSTCEAGLNEPGQPWACGLVVRLVLGLVGAGVVELPPVIIERRGHGRFCRPILTTADVSDGRKLALTGGVGVGVVQCGGGGDDGLSGVLRDGSFDDALDDDFAAVVDEGSVAGAGQGGPSAHGDGEGLGFPGDVGVAASGYQHTFVGGAEQDQDCAAGDVDLCLYGVGDNHLAGDLEVLIGQLRHRFLLAVLLLESGPAEARSATGGLVGMVWWVRDRPTAVAGPAAADRPDQLAGVRREVPSGQRL